jgi:hypothetical protein
MEESVCEMGKSCLKAPFNYSMHQRIGRALIPVLIVCEDIQDRSDLAAAHQLDIAHKLVTDIGAYKIGPIQEAGMILLYLLKGLSIVSVSPALPDW